jgi:tripartite-type tricarboxylate transporter receptor subunit TctC
MKRSVWIASMALVAAPCALAQGYPTKPVRMVVGFAPGGAPDILARILGQKLSEQLGQPVVVDNRPGATGNIAAEIVARGQPDGYSLLMATASIAIAPGLYPKLPFDPVKDLAPVTMVASVPLILVVNPAVPAKSVAELIQVAKAKPRGLNYASVGNGSPQHLSGELFKLMADVDIVHIPYRGGAPAVTAVLANEAQLFFAGMPPALPHVKSGRLRALAVTTAKRSPAAPDVPTMIQAGLAGFEADNWHAILAAQGTPVAIVAKLNAEIARALKLADVRERMGNEGAEAAASTPAELGGFMKNEVEKWAKVVRASGAKPE